jgi:hypothetical protein
MGAAGGSGWAVKIDGGTFTLDYWTGSATVGGTYISTFNTGEWYYLVVRCITTTNRRTAVLRAGSGTGSSHAQSTDSFTPTAPTVMVLGGWHGGASDASGDIAEWWFANADIQPDGLQLQEAMLSQLAYSGPFSVPGLAARITEYRSFRCGTGSDQDVGGEVYQTGGGPWAATNVPAVTAHPALYSTYVKPRQSPRFLVV